MFFRAALACVALLATLGVASRASAQLVVEREAWRPPPLTPKIQCDLWRGGADDKDPTRLIELQLCGDGDHVTGVTQTSSHVSGWAKRTVEGDWRERRTKLQLRERAADAEDKPKAGWRFCKASIAELALSADGLELRGSYFAADCNLRGDVWYRLDHHTDDAVPEARARAVRLEASAVPPTHPAPRSKLSCSSSIPCGLPERGSAALSIGIALAAALRRRPKA